MPCKDCKAPWSGAALRQGIKSGPCETCAGSGWLIENVRLACLDCFGLGVRYSGLAPK
jgi:hypothetical protein